MVDDSGAINLPPVHDDSNQTVFVPWTDGRAIGYRVERPGRPDEYIYLNPSEDTAPHAPDVFVYHGTKGDINEDHPCHFYMVQEQGRTEPPHPRL